MTRYPSPLNRRIPWIGPPWCRRRTAAHPHGGRPRPARSTRGGAAPCIAPGLYELTFDPKARYRSEIKGQKCDTESTAKLGLRLEYLGSELYGDSLDEEGEDAWPGSIVLGPFKGGCNLDLEYNGEDNSAHVVAKLTFSGLQVTGTGSTVTYRIIESDVDMWNCTAANVAITGRLL